MCIAKLGACLEPRWVWCQRPVNLVSTLLFDRGCCHDPETDFLGSLHTRLSWWSALGSIAFDICSNQLEICGYWTTTKSACWCMNWICSICPFRVKNLSNSSTAGIKGFRFMSSSWRTSFSFSCASVSSSICCVFSSMRTLSLWIPHTAKRGRMPLTVTFTEYWSAYVVGKIFAAQPRSSSPRSATPDADCANLMMWQFHVF